MGFVTEWRINPHFINIQYSVSRMQSHIYFCVRDEMYFVFSKLKIPRCAHDMPCKEIFYDA